MSTKKGINRLFGWYENLNFLRKNLYVYILCGVIPLLVLLFVYYTSTTKLLTEQIYNSIQNETAVTGNSFSTALQPPKTLIETLKNDKNLNSMLNADYRNQSYADLAYYMENHVDSLLTVYPYISEIHLYSTNRTLPDDEYYFYSYGELDSSLTTELDATSGGILLTERLIEGRETLCLLSRLNYYGSGSMHHIIEIVFTDDFTRNLIQEDDSARNLYLLDTVGMVVCSSDEDAIGKPFTGYYLKWSSIASDTICTERDVHNEENFCTRTDLGMGLTLFLEYPKSGMLSDVNRVPLYMLIFFLLLSLILFFIMAGQSQHMDQRLRKIIAVMNQIGSGDFTHRLSPRGHAEFGQIETAVNQMNTQIDTLIRDNYENRLMLKTTELNLLQEQINPHFLYNALGLISSLSIRENARTTSGCIRYLADFYRISLNKGRSIIHIQEEFDLLKNYMQIQLLRFSDLVEIRYDLDPAIAEYYTLKLLLQPLVENAIHHAREEEMFISIQVRGFRQGERIIFEVEDNGKGILPEKLEFLREQLARQEEGFGLKNVDKRIKLTYGQEYGLQIDSTYGSGTRIHLEIPVCTER